MISYIEMIGPQGVGKTTLLNELIKTRPKNHNWRIYPEAVSEMADTLSWDKYKRINGKFLHLLHKCNLTGFKNQGISNLLIREATVDFPVEIQKKYEYLMDSQFKAFEKINLDISPINRFYQIDWHMKALDRIFTLEMHNYRKTVLFDEGPLKTHYGLELLDQQKTGRDTLPKAVVYCYVGLKENKERLVQRMDHTGRLSKFHNKLNSEDFETIVEFTHKVIDRNMVVIKELGIPVHEIELSKRPDKKRLEKLAGFLEEHSMQA